MIHREQLYSCKGYIKINISQIVSIQGPKYFTKK